MMIPSSVPQLHLSYGKCSSGISTTSGLLESSNECISKHFHSLFTVQTYILFIILFVKKIEDVIIITRRHHHGQNNTREHTLSDRMNRMTFILTVLPPAHECYSESSDATQPLRITIPGIN